ncbi:PucR family transcriptional regulator [Streptomyces sp. BI20]|uniref:PucR family transcriptional regulator n=1 Tax=Streptomyces sp. BI20 TaxID=3403460 RepID=UPI003C721FAA
MHVRDLLHTDSLGLTLLWGEESLLGQEVSGVTATDLDDPGRFLGPGEIVLSGLVWWTPGEDPTATAKTERFVTALAEAGATALLAGEETHGRVPDEILAACRAHRVPLLAVPARTSFRAVTEAVYLRQWGDLSRRPTRLFALPENVRNELSGLLEAGAEPAELLDRACAHLGRVPAYLLTAAGRTVARTPGAPPLSPERVRGPGGPGAWLRVAADSSPYDAWHLHLPDPDAAPPRVLHEVAEVLAQHRDGTTRARARARARAQDLVNLIAGAGAVDPGTLEEALTAAGLPTRGPYRVLTATSGDALAEALAAHDLPHAVGTSVAVVHAPGEDLGQALREARPRLLACAPDTDLRIGLGAPAAGPEALRSSLNQARFALTASDTAHPVRAVDELDSLGALLTGIPPEVRQVFGTSALGPLGDGMLRETLEVFLAHNCSWTRTAEALHLHVNTVHYRMERVESLTGRDLSRLDHKLDLYAALHC